MTDRPGAGRRGTWFDGRAMNVGRMLETTARRLPGHTAVTWGSRDLTYAEFDRRTNALAHGLASLGVQRGDRVGVLMRNRPELLEAMYACFKAGYCLVPLNSRFTTDDVAYHVADSAATAVLTDAEGAAVVVGAEIGGVSIVVAGRMIVPKGRTITKRWWPSPTTRARSCRSIATRWPGSSTRRARPDDRRARCSRTAT